MTYEYDVPIDNRNMRFGVIAHHDSLSVMRRRSGKKSFNYDFANTVAKERK